MAFLPATFRGEQPATKVSIPSWLSRKVTPLLEGLAQISSTRPIYTVALVASIASVSYIGLLEDSKFAADQNRCTTHHKLRSRTRLSTTAIAIAIIHQVGFSRRLHSNWLRSADHDSRKARVRSALQITLRCKLAVYQLSTPEYSPCLQKSPHRQRASDDVTKAQLSDKSLASG